MAFMEHCNDIVIHLLNITNDGAIPICLPAHICVMRNNAPISTLPFEGFIFVEIRESELNGTVGSQTHHPHLIGNFISLMIKRL